MTAPASAVSKLLLGSDPRQLLRVSQAMLVLAVYVAAESETENRPFAHDPAIDVGDGRHHAVRIGTLRARLQEQRAHLEQQRAELADALERIRALATHDELTGLANRRAALDRMHDELAVRGRPEPLMSLALMDLDHFKLINDAHSHAAGDVVLQRFGEVAQTALRAGDMLARWGGEEFLLVMPATAPKQALAAMERVKQALRNASFDDVAPGLVVTFSAGVSECEGEHDLAAAIARADAAMYEAKRTGRDRVVAGAKSPGRQREPADLVL